MAWRSLYRQKACLVRMSLRYDLDLPPNGATPRDVRWARQWIRMSRAGLGLALLIGCVLFFGLLVAADGLLDTDCGEATACGAQLLGVVVLGLWSGLLIPFAAAIAGAVARARKRRRLRTYRDDAGRFAGTFRPDVQRRIDAWRHGLFWGETLVSTATFLRGLTVVLLVIAAFLVPVGIIVLDDAGGRWGAAVFVWTGILVAAAILSAARSRWLYREGVRHVERLRTDTLRILEDEGGRPTMQPAP